MFYLRIHNWIYKWKPMKINIEMTEEDLKTQVINWFEKNTALEIDPKDIRIMVKSKQNYKSEWEVAEFKATVNIDKEMK